MNICDPCGNKHGKRIRPLSTWHSGTCEYCKGKQYVTEDRDYGISKKTDSPEMDHLMKIFNMKP